MRSTSRHLAFGAFAAMFLASVTSHATGFSSQVWGVDRDEFSDRLRNGDYEFLTLLDLSTETPDRTILEAARLGDEGLHMLGLIYEDLGLTLPAERLFAASWNEISHPWRHESLLELLNLLDDDERYSELETIARHGRRVYGTDQEILRFLIGSLYRQEKDAEVVELSALLEADPGDLDAVQAEDLLRRAVSSSRLGLPGWEEGYRELFGRFPAGDAHSRVWIYLLGNLQVSSHFSLPELTFFEAKRLLAEGRSTEAADLFSQVAIVGEPDQQDPNARRLLISPAGLRDFYLAGSLSGRQSATASALIDLADGAGADGLPGNLGARALEYAGRLYRTAGNYRLAADTLGRALLVQPPGPDAERLRWYWLSSRVRMDPLEVADSLGAITPTLGDPAYYSDLFAELAVRLSGIERWDALLQAYQAIRGFATPGTLATYELILAEASGALPTGNDDGDALRAAYLEQAAAQREDLYSAMVASYLLGGSGEVVLGSITATPGARTGTPPAVPNHTLGDPWVSDQIVAYLRFGLLDRAYAEFRSNPTVVGAPLVFELADRLAESGRVRESVQVATRTPLTSDAQAAEETLLRRYPQAFPAVFDEVLVNEAVDRWVLYALVREESLFDPAIVSAAGAIGLTQLLPDTALDVARRMRIDPPDLTNPAANLRVGAHYLWMLDIQFGGLVKALAAYNAGQGRVRSWERERPGLSGVLFHQSIPYEETLNHIRQIVVSAAYYGYLYDGRTPTETVRIFFTDRSE